MKLRIAPPVRALISFPPDFCKTLEDIARVKEGFAGVGCGDKKVWKEAG